MYIMTFEEWRAANQDIEAEVCSWTHLSGVSYGKLSDQGMPGYVETEIMKRYNVQVSKD